LVDKNKKKKVRNYPDHVCHGFFYLHDNTVGHDGVDAVTEKDIMQYRGFDHPVIEKPVAERSGRRRIIKPRADNKIDNSGNYPKTDNVVVKHPAFPKIPGKDKQHQDIAHVKGKPGLEGNVVKTQKLPHRKEQQNRRMGKDYRFPVPFRFKKVTEYQTAADCGNRKHARKKAKTVKRMIKKKAYALRRKDKRKKTYVNEGPAGGLPAGKEQTKPASRDKQRK
jgi:hypothetical protein